MFHLDFEYLTRQPPRDGPPQAPPKPTGQCAQGESRPGRHPAHRERGGMAAGIAEHELGIRAARAQSHDAECLHLRHRTPAAHEVAIPLDLICDGLISTQTPRPDFAFEFDGVVDGGKVHLTHRFE